MNVRLVRWNQSGGIGLLTWIHHGVPHHLLYNTWAYESKKPILARERPEVFTKTGLYESAYIARLRPVGGGSTANLYVDRFVRRGVERKPSLPTSDSGMGLGAVTHWALFESCCYKPKDAVRLTGWDSGWWWLVYGKV